MICAVVSFLTKSLVNKFDVYTHPNLLLIWKNKSNQNSITYPVNNASITFNQNNQDLSGINNMSNLSNVRSNVVR